MTVSELISKLSELPPDTPVLVYDTGGEGVRSGYRDCTRVHTIKLAPRSRGSSPIYPQFDRLTDRNTLEVVCVE